MPQTTPEWRQNATETELRARAAEMRSEWGELSKSDRESDDFRSAKREFLAEMEDIDVHLDLADRAEMRSRPAPAAAVGMPGQKSEFRSPGDEVANHAEFRAWCAEQQGRSGLSKESPTVELRTLITEGSSSGNLLPVGQPYLVNPARMRLTVRDLLTTVPTSLTAVPYIREAGNPATTTAATTVAEGGTKPEAAISFTPDLAPVQVIAVNIPVTTQMLEDAPSIAGYINGRLVYMLKLTEETQLLRGNGTAPNLKGILSYSGVQSQARTDVGGPEFSAVTLGNAMAKVEAAYGAVDGIVIHPTDAWAMFMNRGATSGYFDAGSPFSDLPLNVWGMRTVRSTAATAGTAIVGSWALGATLFDRRSANVRVYEQHANFPVLNQVLIQAEERLALAVNRPEWFCTADLSHS